MIAVCKHGRKVDVKFFQPEKGGGFYVQKASMPMCDDCVIEATMEAMEKMTEPFEVKP